MDGFTLRCNVIPCRSPLDQRAVVTTCSHIFCVSCAEATGLATLDQHFGARVCPACNTNLPTVDDAVLTLVNPPDEYKTSVLSGMSPTIIMEIASRGMAFWHYQATQEM